MATHPDMDRESGASTPIGSTPASGFDALDLLPFGCFLVDSSLHVVKTNRCFQRLIGCKLDHSHSLGNLGKILNIDLEASCRRALNTKSQRHQLLKAQVPESSDESLFIALAPADEAAETGELWGIVGRIKAKNTVIDNRGMDTDRSSFLAHVTHQIAHELRNPCTIIGGFAALLRRDLDLADKLSEYAGIIMDEALRVEKTLNEVLNFSESLAKTKAHVDLNELVVDAVDKLRVDSGACGPGFEIVRCDEVLPVLVNGEQAVQSISDILAILCAGLPESVTIRIATSALGESNRVEFDFVNGSPDAVRIEDSLSRLFSGGSQASGLRLTLAVEAIRFNDGEFEISGSSEGGTRLSVAYPAVEVHHV